MSSAPRTTHRALGAVVAATALLALTVPAANAAYPGDPGVIVFGAFGGGSVLYVRERWELDEEGFPYPVEGQLWVVDVSTGTQRQLTFDDTLKGTARTR